MPVNRKYFKRKSERRFRHKQVRRKRARKLFAMSRIMSISLGGINRIKNITMQTDAPKVQRKIAAAQASIATISAQADAIVEFNMACDELKLAERRLRKAA